MKSSYEKGTPEFEAYEAGKSDERSRLRKVLEKYHQTFGSGDVKDSETTMQIKYLYDYVVETRALK